MARLTTPLTAKEIQSAKPREKEYKLFDGGGLYFRGLDSLGQHLIATNYGSCSVVICGCEIYMHSDTCPIPYLKKYLKKKNVEIDRYR